MTEAGAPSPAVAELPLVRSFSSNIIGVAWMAAMQLAFTPLFIRHVGVEGYGLIGFYITLQALLQIVDFGFAPTINRWLSRYAAGHEEPQHARDLAKTLEIASWCIAAAAGALLIGCAGLVAQLWLRNANLDDATLRKALILMAGAIVAHLPTTYYQSGLLGLRRPLSMNVVKAIAATASTAGAAVVLIQVSSTVEAYFAVQAGVGVLHALLLRVIFWRSLTGDAGRFRLDVLRSAWRFTTAMTGIAICAAVAAQVDRLILSRLVSLEVFGYYAVARVVASGLAVISLPAMNTLFPRFSGIFAAGDQAGLRSGYHDGAQATSVLLLPLAAVLVLFAAPLLLAWTGDPNIARNAAPIVVLLTIGSALNGLMHSVYALQLAAGATRLALGLTIAQIVVIVPLVIVLTMRYGVLGAALAWPVMNALYFIVGGVTSLRKLIPGALRDWLLRDVGVPLVAANAVAALSWAFVPLPSSRVGVILVIGVVLMLTTIAAAFATHTTRRAILRHL